MSKKYAKLIMVSTDNNNKYYEMFWDGTSSNMQVKYGRVESTAVERNYPSYDWDSIYRSKVKKGYKDVTDMVSVEVTKDKTEEIVYIDIEDAKVAAFITIMKKYTDGLVSKTYSVKSDKVTKKQVDEAQKILDNLADLAKAKKKDVTLINTKLVELYMIIPRYIKDVRKEILPHIKLEETLSQEQDNLDAMALQVNMNTKSKEATKSEVKKKKSILDSIGVEMKPIAGTSEINHLVKQITGKKVQSIFEVEKPKEDERFDKWLKDQDNKKTRFVYHGTRCTSVIPILEQGLKIRPSGNFQFSGKAYGNGNYFSDQYNTSIGYTGSDSDNVLLVYEIHTGKESKNCFTNYTDCKRAGYDSFEGGWLRVAYHESQARIKYIIWLK